MKNFTKAALIITLVLVILGSAFCAVGMGIGFSFPEFWEHVEMGEYSFGPFFKIPLFRHEGESTVSMGTDGPVEQYAEEYAKEYADEVTEAVMGGTEFPANVPQAEEMGGYAMASEQSHFPWEAIKNLEVEGYFGTVVIVESSRENQDEIFVDVDYAKENGKSNVKMHMEGDTLQIEETEKDSARIRHKESISITIEIPARVIGELWLEKIELEQENGNIYMDAPLTAEKIKIKVEKGECIASAPLTATDKIEIEVGAGNGTFDSLESKSLKAEAGMGTMAATRVSTEDISMECGMGEIEFHVVGKESDYSYQMKCGIGTIEVGDSSYSGLAGEKKIKNPGSKKMDVECGMGSIFVHFSET